MKLGDTTQAAHDAKDLGRLYAANQPAKQLVSMLGDELLGVEVPPGALTMVWALNYKVGPLSPRDPVVDLFEAKYGQAGIGLIGMIDSLAQRHGSTMDKQYFEEAMRDLAGILLRK